MPLHPDVRIDGIFYMSGPDGLCKVCIQDTQWTDAPACSFPEGWGEQLGPKSPVRCLSEFAATFPGYQQELRYRRPHGLAAIPPLAHRRSDGAFLGGVAYTQQGWVAKMRDGSLGSVGSLEQAMSWLYTSQPLDPLPWEHVVRMGATFCLPILEICPNCWLRLESLAPGMDDNFDDICLWTMSSRTPVLCGLFGPAAATPNSALQHIGAIRATSSASPSPYRIRYVDTQISINATRVSYVRAIHHLAHLALQEASAHLRAHSAYKLSQIETLITAQQAFQHHGPKITPAVPAAYVV